MKVIIRTAAHAKVDRIRLMTKIPELKLNTGASIPAIGFGTWQLEQGDEAEDSTASALELGYRLIDTAKIYGNETDVGRAINKSSVAREEIFLTTKLWKSDMGHDRALEIVETSLKNLAVDYVDLYLIHWPSSAELDRETWRAFEEIHKSGKAKAVGVSNFEVEDLEELLSSSKLTPAVNQIEFHPLIYKLQKPILEFCKKHNIVVEAYSPLARRQLLDDPVIGEIADKLKKTSAQVVLRWAIQQGTVPIPKSAHKERIRENLDVFDFELSQDDIEAINNLSTGESVI